MVFFIVGFFPFFKKARAGVILVLDEAVVAELVAANVALQAIVVTQGNIVTATVATAKSTGALEAKEFTWDTAAWAAAKLAIRELTTSIVNWINSGFEGNPSFITNFEGFMTDIADEVIGNYIEGSSLAFLCSSFSLDVKLALYARFYAPTAPTCTLSEAIENAGGALQSLADDFRWGTWFSMTSSQSNNAYGAYILAEEDITQKINEALGRKTEQLSWGKGFLSWDECEECEETLPGGTVHTYRCNCVTQTPGTVVETQLNNWLDTERESLATADEINEIITALLMQLISEVMSSEGLLGSG